MLLAGGGLDKLRESERRLQVTVLAVGHAASARQPRDTVVHVLT